jgi:hypothetical protein
MQNRTRHGIDITSFGDTVLNFGREIPIRNERCHDYSQSLLENVVMVFLCRPRMIADIFIYDIFVGDANSSEFITRRRLVRYCL